MNTTICPGCGKECVVKKQRKFCSKECAFKNRKQRPRNLKTCTCEWCNKVFDVWACRQGRFCSPLCTSRYAASLGKGGQQPKPEIHIKLNCKTCGNAYETTTHQVRTRGSSYCSKECKYKRMSELKRKDGNPNYRGGKVTWRGRNWGSQSRQALKRDGYCCQICHKRLSRKKYDYGVHHIKPYREFNGDYETANQLSNLITLCRSCHSKVEHGGLPCPKPLF